MEEDLEEKEIDKLKEVFSQPLKYKKEKVSTAELCEYLWLNYNLIASYTGLSFHGNMPA